VKLKDKVQLALDESRMLILGVQVLLGFDLQAFLMAGWDALPHSSHVAKLVSLGLHLTAMTVLLAPVARHRLVDDGRDTPRLHGFTRRAVAIALLPFALGMALDFYVVGVRASGTTLGVALAVATAVVAIAGWYVLPSSMRRRELRAEEDEMEKATLDDKIRHVLTEARVVLPGTQALLGFQFAAVLQQGFEQLPASSKVIHVAALVALGASVVFLMLPTAFHRIAERGDISERLHRFSSVSILLAMFTLAVAVAGDTFIVVRKATGSISAAVGVSAAWLTLALAVWFGLMFYLRRRGERGAPPDLRGALGFERG
jgi:hypothetical protein